MGYIPLCKLILLMLIHSSKIGKKTKKINLQVIFQTVVIYLKNQVLIRHLTVLNQNHGLHSKKTIKSMAIDYLQTSKRKLIYWAKEDLQLYSKCCTMELKWH